jgi:hypothetical protein
MKQFASILAVALALFVVANAISYFVLSDGHGVGIVNDGMQRAGFPWLFWERGGFVYRHTFRSATFAADVGVASVGGVLVYWIVTSRWSKGKS